MHTKINIVEDSREYQASLMMLIKGSDRFELGEVFDTAEQAIPAVGTLTGIMIVDVKLPGMHGPELIKLVSEHNPDVQCLVCSMYDDDEFIFTALKNGALGYLLKDSTGEQIINALTELENGGSPMSPYIARRVIDSFHVAREQQPKNQLISEILSDREYQVIQLLATGLIYKQIAEKLFISHQTVKQHIKNIYQKLHVQNKVEALNKLHPR